MIGDTTRIYVYGGFIAKTEQKRLALQYRDTQVDWVAHIYLGTENWSKRRANEVASVILKPKQKRRCNKYICRSIDLDKVGNNINLLKKYEKECCVINCYENQYYPGQVTTY